MSLTTSPTLSHFSVRYPPVDPHDPFAPLSILRGRLTSLHTFPNSPIITSPIPFPSQEPVKKPLHYRRRSHSNPAPVPSLPYHSVAPVPPLNITSYPRTHFPTPVQTPTRLTPVPSISADDSSTQLSHDGHQRDNNLAYRKFPVLAVDSPSPSPTDTKAPSWARLLDSKLNSLPSTDAHKSPASLPSSPLSPNAEFYPRTTPRRPSTADTFHSVIPDSECSSIYPTYPQHYRPSYTHARLPSTLSRNYPDSPALPSRKLSRSSHATKRVLRRPPPPTPSQRTALPTIQQLAEAASINVIAENGLRVPFGQLWLEQKTVVCFIRHFWCPMCQDYMYSITRTVTPKALRRAGVNLVIIGNGSHNMIPAYRQIFRTNLPVYTDPTNRLYAALGMTLRTLKQGPDSERGSYVRHGIFSGMAMVVMNAVKVRMPLLEHGGELSQLGGEFVLGPGLACTYAHRMHTTRSHSPIARVLEAAGLDVYTSPEQASLARPKTMSEEERETWMRARQESFERLKERKACRRRGCQNIPVCGGGVRCSVVSATLGEIESVQAVEPVVVDVVVEEEEIVLVKEEIVPVEEEIVLVEEEKKKEEEEEDAEEPSSGVEDEWSISDASRLSESGSSKSSFDSASAGFR